MTHELLAMSGRLRLNLKTHNELMHKCLRLGLMQGSWDHFLCHNIKKLQGVMH
jgi:hypothetical protein